jgi:hypothetical protein
VVEEHNLDLSAVVGIDDAGPNVNAVLGGEARAGRYPAIGTGGDSDGNLGRDEVAATGGKRNVLRGVEVVAG